MRFPAISLGLGLAFMAFLGCDEPQLRRQLVKFPNGALKEAYTEKQLDGGTFVRHGLYKEFYENGAIRQTVQYVDGKKDSIAMAWHPDGKLLWTKKYHLGERAGTWQLSIPSRGATMVANFEGDQLSGEARFYKETDTSFTVSARFEQGRCAEGDCRYFSIGPKEDEPSPVGKLKPETISEFLEIPIPGGEPLSGRVRDTDLS